MRYIFNFRRLIFTVGSKHTIPIEMEKVYNRGNCYISASGLLFDMVRHPCCNVCVCFRKTSNSDQNDVQSAK